MFQTDLGRPSACQARDAACDLGTAFFAALALETVLCEPSSFGFGFGSSQSGFEQLVLARDIHAPQAHVHPCCPSLAASNSLPRGISEAAAPEAEAAEDAACLEAEACELRQLRPPELHAPAPGCHFGYAPNALFFAEESGAAG